MRCELFEELFAVIAPHQGCGYLGVVWMGGRMHDVFGVVGHALSRLSKGMSATCAVVK
jgi:hypothetical protein